MVEPDTRVLGWAGTYLTTLCRLLASDGWRLSVGSVAAAAGKDELTCLHMPKTPRPQAVDSLELGL